MESSLSDVGVLGPLDRALRIAVAKEVRAKDGRGPGVAKEAPDELGTQQEVFRAQNCSSENEGGSGGDVGDNTLVLVAWED